MTKKRTVPDETEPKGSNGILFINYDLADDVKKQFKVWVGKNTDRLEDMMNSVVEAGYQVSVKTDTFNDCIGAYLIAKGTKTENDGYILCGRSRTATGALFGLFFRHFVVFEQMWPVHNHRANPIDDFE
jgi:hypothetical protein